MKEINSAEQATEIAVSFVKRYRFIALPLKAVREGEVWTVEIDVGPLAVRVAKVKVDAKTGKVLHFEIPPV